MMVFDGRLEVSISEIEAVLNPTGWQVTTNQVNDRFYTLRPETVESYFIMWRSVVLVARCWTHPVIIIQHNTRPKIPRLGLGSRAGHREVLPVSAPIYGCYVVTV